MARHEPPSTTVCQRRLKGERGQIQRWDTILGCTAPPAKLCPAPVPFTLLSTFNCTPRDRTYLRVNLAHVNVTHGDLLPNPVVPRIVPLLFVHLFRGIVTSLHEIEQDRRAQPTGEPDRQVPPRFEHRFLLAGYVYERLQPFFEFVLYERVETGS
jgi:hypothetical protein